MKKAALVILMTVLVLSGCSTIYYLEDAEYEGKKKYIAARAAMHTRCIESTEPLPTPLIERKLIALIPSQEFIYTAIQKNFKDISPDFPMSREDLRIEPLYSGANENFRMVVELIKKKNLYRTVEMIEYESLSIPEASADTDIFHVVLATATNRNDKYYLTREKRGKLRIDYGAMNPDCANVRISFMSSIQCETFRDNLLSSLQTLALQ
ncbi:MULTISPECIES: hypothetical protein [unclassified Nitrosomonas]|uniref:hypothetical protein n=1 Tax=unclassified Nitrosomonas TaxID=2609265 RepID=UPI00089D4D5F|nr:MULTISPECIES: hypothetical protein [unclassified Nitrosomonas]MDV6345310.1 hypothetical protein [Nitrosomonas sp. Is37]SDY13008.1 hypothetical protein SAMN05421755_100854 [Nitrosomonas sp. Nm33]